MATKRRKSVRRRSVRKAPRRRLHGLGGSPQEHAGKARDAATQAQRVFEQAKSAADRNRCDVAFSLFSDANYEFGKAMAHLDESGQKFGSLSSLHDRLAVARHDANEAARHCFSSK